MTLLAHVLKQLGWPFKPKYSDNKDDTSSPGLKQLEWPLQHKHFNVMDNPSSQSTKTITEFVDVQQTQNSQSTIYHSRVIHVYTYQIWR